MTTINIRYNGRGKHNQSKGMQLNGNILTGDTFNVRNYIKTQCDGKWSNEHNGWIVNVEKVMTLLNTPGAQISKA